MNINNNSGFFYSDILNAGTDIAEINTFAYAVSAMED